mmetsp:Transcript_239/g.755  ORF Transcript_239/g.755 Transcript_239/m.755 type:complete len:106 (-) Transcript_239:230-547(-)
MCCCIDAGVEDPVGWLCCCAETYAVCYCMDYVCYNIADCLNCLLCCPCRTLFCCDPCGTSRGGCCCPRRSPECHHHHHHYSPFPAMAPPSLQGPPSRMGQWSWAR